MDSQWAHETITLQDSVSGCVYALYCLCVRLRVLSLLNVIHCRAYEATKGQSLFASTIMTQKWRPLYLLFSYRIVNPTLDSTKPMPIHIRTLIHFATDAKFL